jgi:hypothetical protein
VETGPLEAVFLGFWTTPHSGMPNGSKDYGGERQKNYEYNEQRKPGHVKSRASA